MPAIILYLAILVLFLLSGSLSIADQQQKSEDDFSQANKALFFEEHLGNIAQPLTLRYQFSKTGVLEDEFQDKINVHVKKSANEGFWQAQIDFFTGDRQRNFPVIDNASGNPLLTLFLQRDVREMGRLTGGNWRHFQKQIKLALEDSAVVKPVKVQLGDQSVTATQIEIYPYRDDPYIDKFKEFSSKLYRFTLVESLPGMFYEIQAMAKSPKGTILIDESVTFAAALAPSQ